MLKRRDFIAGVTTSVAAMTVMSSRLANAAPAPVAAPEPTASLNVVYPNHAGARFDTSYYRATHVPLVMKVMKADSVILIEGVPMGNAPAAIVLIAHFQFASSAALQAGLANPAMAEVRADVANFTDIKPTVMLGKSL